MISRCLLGVVSAGLLCAVAAGLRMTAAAPRAASVMVEVFIVFFSGKWWLDIQRDDLTGTEAQLYTRRRPAAGVRAVSEDPAAYERRADRRRGRGGRRTLADGALLTPAASSSTSAASRAERASAGSPRTRAAASAPSKRIWSWVARASGFLASRRSSRARYHSRRCSLNCTAILPAGCLGSPSSVTALT